MSSHIHSLHILLSNTHLLEAFRKILYGHAFLHISLLLDHWMVRPIHTYISSTQVTEPEHTKADRTKNYTSNVAHGPFFFLFECSAATVFRFVTFHWTGYLLYETID
jgi:hypothetical protein